MSRPTVSELLFESFCEAHRIRCFRVAAGTTRSPDYDVFLGRRKVVVEVKEIEPNSTERAALAAANRGEFVAVSITPGQKVRGKISDAGPQIKARAKGRSPGLLVLYEGSWLPNHLDEYQVRVAMFGFEAVVFNVPKDPRASPNVAGHKYGGSRKMTPHHSTSISAVAILRDGESGPSLTVFHNPHAKLPLWADRLSMHGVQQCKLAESKANTIAKWEEVR